MIIRFGNKSSLISHIYCKMRYSNLLFNQIIKKRSISFFLILLLPFLSFSQARIVNPNGSFVVVIDAGHGGKDPGAKGIFSVEKDITLDIALTLGKLIEENLPDVKIIYTRTADVFVPLYERAHIANKNKADLFMSIHVDGVPKKHVVGTSTFVMGLHKEEENLEVAKRENAVIELEENTQSFYEGFNAESPEMFIKMSLAQKSNLDLSLAFASGIQDEFELRAKRVNRGVKQAGFIVLWATTMPAVLIETGFLTNPDEEKYLNTKEGKDYIASAIFRSFKSYKTSVETKSGSMNEMVNSEPEKQNTLYYTIQIAATSKPINLTGKKYKKYEDIEVVSDENGFKYYIGRESNWENAQQRLAEIKADFKDAFPVAFFNDKKISVKDARQLQLIP